ncbi:MAG: glycine cleavage system protein R [Pontibacterium sp.]
MITSLVLTVIGPDRPGLVERLSQTIAGHNGSWLESGMSQLAGKFAGILVVQVPTDKLQVLVADLQKLETEGLKVVAETAQGDEVDASSQHLVLDLIGQDKPGIVKEISQALAQRNVNVEKLSTELVSGSMSAEQLFQAKITLSAPEDLDIDALQDDLEALANDLMVDITLK